MNKPQSQARLEFQRIVKWIALIGVLMTAAALIYLWLMGSWSVHAVIATILGVSVSVLLGCGLFALAFFSNKSGHDDAVNTAVKKPDDK